MTYREIKRITRLVKKALNDPIEVVKERYARYEKSQKMCSLKY